MSNILTVVLIIAGLLYWIGSTTGEENDKLPKNYPVSQATYSQVEREVGCMSKFSDDKKEDIFNTQYKNHKMTWRGVVSLVESDEVSLNLDGKGISDINIDFLNSKEGYDLQKDQVITVEFIMHSMGGCFLSFRGKRGKVIW